MMKTEVTQGLYMKVMGKNPSSFVTCGSKCPVEQINFYDAVQFANKLSEFHELTSCYTTVDEEVLWSDKSCNGWRLPTEAEWEYAAKGGKNYKYAGNDNLKLVGWYQGNSSMETHPGCSKKPNGYGLCDMNGNVSEWTWDFFGHYGSATQIDPYGKDDGTYKVIRGGSWNSSSFQSTNIRRGKGYAFQRGFDRGFRLVRNVD